VFPGAGIRILVSHLPFGDPWNDLEALANLVGKENVVRVVFLVGKMGMGVLI
jgi:hypothetical protein